MFSFKDEGNKRQEKRIIILLKKNKLRKPKNIPNIPINGEKSSFECLIELTYRKSFRASSPNKSLIRCEMQWKNHLERTTEKLILL